DIGPGLHRRRDEVVRFRVVLLQKFERAIREHEAEAEARVGRVLLEYANLDLGTAPLQKIGEVKPGRPGSDDRDSHGARDGINKKKPDLSRDRASGAKRW